MTLYQHRFSGTLPAGDEFVFSWWANSIRGLGAANTAAVTWLNTLCSGADGLLSMLTAGVVIRRVATGSIDPANGRQQTLAEEVVFQQGTHAGSTLPQEVALVVSLRTALANRRGRGRFYLPCLAAGTTTATGKVDPTVQTNLVAALLAAWEGYNTGTDFPVVYSRTNRTSQLVTAFDVGDLYDIQKRRDNAVAQTRVSEPMP